MGRFRNGSTIRTASRQKPRNSLRIVFCPFFDQVIMDDRKQILTAFQSLTEHRHVSALYLLQLYCIYFYCVTSSRPRRFRFRPPSVLRRSAPKFKNFRKKSGRVLRPVLRYSSFCSAFCPSFCAVSSVKLVSIAYLFAMSSTDAPASSLVSTVTCISVLSDMP